MKLNKPSPVVLNLLPNSSILSTTLVNGSVNSEIVAFISSTANKNDSIPNDCNCLLNISKLLPTPLNASPNLTSDAANCSSTSNIFNCLFCYSVRLSNTVFCPVSISPSNSINLIPASSPGPPKTLVIIPCVCCASKLTSFNPFETN